MISIQKALELLIGGESYTVHLLEQQHFYGWPALLLSACLLYFPKDTFPFPLQEHNDFPFSASSITLS